MSELLELMRSNIFQSGDIMTGNPPLRRKPPLVFGDRFWRYPGFGPDWLPAVSGGRVRSARFEGFPACTQSQNPKIFSPAALLEPFRVYLRGKARRRRKIFTIWGAEIEIYKGESPPQARKNRDFGHPKYRFSRGKRPKMCQIWPKSWI